MDAVIQPDSPRHVLDNALRLVLAELELISAGTIYSYSPVGTKTGFSSGLPVTGDASRPDRNFLRAYLQQTDGWGRCQIVRQAREERDRLRRRHVPEGFTEKPENADERRERFLREGEGVPLKRAAYLLNCSERELRRMRDEDRRDIQFGRRIEAPEGTPRDRALTLAGQGLTQRQIAMHLKVSQPTVQRLLAAA